MFSFTNMFRASLLQMVRVRALFAAFAFLICLFAVQSASAAVFTVNTTADTQDASAGNGVCADSGGSCSLRAAITEANALSGADTITLPAGTYTQSLDVTTIEDANAGGDYDITSDITINGAGAAATIIQAATTRNTSFQLNFDVLTGASLTLGGVTVRHGRGGIRFRTGAVAMTVSDSVIADNNAVSGIANAGKTGSPAIVTIRNTTISGNIGGSGAGVNNSAASTGTFLTVNITGSTISGNSTGNNPSVGGGMSNSGVGLTCNLTNSTVSGNTVPNPLVSSDGIFNQSNATLNINFSTIAGNTNSSGNGSVGIRAISGAINIKNSILADNSDGVAGSSDISGTFTSQGYNHIENTTDSTFTPTTGDVTGTDPQLGALSNNGGSTRTQQPAMTSPVVNTIPNGTNGCGTGDGATSQNAVTRPQSTGCEKGSVEIPAAPTAASVSISGRVSLGDGRGLTNAVVYLTDQQGNTRAARTSLNGNFQFDDVAAGETYIVQVISKRYFFTPRVVSVSDNIVGFDLFAEN